MRGLAEIIESNENPAAYHRNREPQHGFTSREDRAEQQRFHGERVEARQAERDSASVRAETNGLFFTALLLDILASSSGRPKAQPEHQERIHSALDAEPPFVKFWQKLNDSLEARDEPEATYGQAKRAFLGGATPVGALTFIGKDWDGLRAIPAPPTDGKKTYHGEFRQVSDEGTIWRTVHSGHGPIAYATPEAALNGAANAKAHSER